MSLSPVNLNLFHFLHSIGFSGLRKFVMKEKWDSVIIKDDHVVKYICFIFLGEFLDIVSFVPWLLLGVFLWKKSNSNFVFMKVGICVGIPAKC